MSAGILKHISEQNSAAAKTQITGTKNSRTVISLGRAASQTIKYLYSEND